jgi:hypothetical protein
MTRHSRRSRYVLWLLLAFVPSRLASQATVDTAAAIQAAAQATDAWLTLVDDGKFGQSWDEAASSFRQAVTRAVWEQSVLSARGPLEPFGARQRSTARYTTQLPNAPPGQYVLFQFQTSVAGGRRVVETVVPVLDGERGWRVSGYFVRPE